MQVIKFAPDLFKLVMEGTKTSTVRKGVRDYTLGPVDIITDPPDRHDRVKVTQRYITKIELKYLDELTDEDARRESYDGLKPLLTRLKHIYPDIDGDSEITVVEFR